jgi:hypothetical protein
MPVNALSNVAAEIPLLTASVRSFVSQASNSSATAGAPVSPHMPNKITVICENLHIFMSISHHIQCRDDRIRQPCGRLLTYRSGSVNHRGDQSRPSKKNGAL